MAGDPGPMNQVVRNPGPIANRLTRRGMLFYACSLFLR
jgi:hypothetical protein